MLITHLAGASLAVRSHGTNHAWKGWADDLPVPQVVIDAVAGVRGQQVQAHLLEVLGVRQGLCKVEGDEIRTRERTSPAT